MKSASFRMFAYVAVALMLFSESDSLEARGGGRSGRRRGARC
jgi:hypothetical protein